MRRRTERSRPERALLVAGAFLMAGCHTYTEVLQPPPGSTVRVRVPVQSPLTGAGGVPATASIEGVVISAGDTLALATQRRHDLGPYRQLIQIDTVRVLRDAVASLEVQELATRRSIVLGVAVTGALTALLLAAFTGVWGGGGTDPPPPPPQTSVFGSLQIGLPAVGGR
jgi:hypothetical protein